MTLASETTFGILTVLILAFCFQLSKRTLRIYVCTIWACSLFMVNFLLGHSDIVGLLISAGAELDMVDSDGKAALHLACQGDW